MPRVQIELFGDVEVSRFVVLDVPDGTDLDQLPLQDITDLFDEDDEEWNVVDRVRYLTWRDVLISPEPEDFTDAVITKKRGKYVVADGRWKGPPTEEDLVAMEVWRPSTSVSHADLERSRLVAGQIHAEPKRCWHNALSVVCQLDTYREASYVEGFACVEDGMQIEHGWVMLRDGTIIDPTLQRPGITYFPGLEFRGRKGVVDFLATKWGHVAKIPPFFYAFGFGGRYCPSYMEARRLATEYSHNLKPPVG